MMLADNIEETMTQSTQPEDYRPLNVKDALTYLDTVKAKFSSEPQVYNQFLDIMKDFKSQMLDTPGVIERVSSLFRGHGTLISGFNTFLPPGYKIECIDHLIKVTTPSGTTCIKESESLVLQQQPKTKQQPVEFNHAITYVNKIKSKYSSQPDTYKRFLEILQTYQKDQKPIGDIYAQVQTLFDGSQELLDEFKQFLPEKKKKKRADIIPTTLQSKRIKHHHEEEVSNVRDMEDLSNPTFSAEEAEFFEKVKTYIGNKATYNAFLKVLNLFSQQIVDQNVLINRVESFIGGNMELFDWFKLLVGYEDTDNYTGFPQTTSRQPQPTDDHDIGPSYRYIPKEWQINSNICSGRDALCWDVLNDTFISHPTWASEDTGFVANKKNQYEEALHRVEEERYDYDLNIEANLNTIALLEPIAKKISIMSIEEKSSFKLSANLGSSSRTIYQRILKKIYQEKGLEIIHLLHQNPSQTIPIVLKRLKQKDDEWKRAQREWNKIWRQVELKNYWKSLDYQGITFKSNDRKQLTSKSLISSASNAEYTFKDPSIFKDISRLIYFFIEKQPVYSSEDCQHIKRFLTEFIPQFLCVADMEPSSIHDDVEMLDYDDQSSVQSFESTKKVDSKKKKSKDVLKDVLTRNINKKYDQDEDMDEEEEDSESESDQFSADSDENSASEEESEDDSESEARRPRRRAAAIAARKSSKNKKTGRVVTKKSAKPIKQGKMPTVASLLEKQQQLQQPSDSVEEEIHLFANNAFYCFIKLYQVLYDRLYMMKQLDAEFKRNPGKWKQANQEAHDLGIKRLKVKMDPSRGCYHLLLSLTDKLFSGELDQQVFEECIRYLFGTGAYIVFTIDKLVLALIRHLHILITDSTSQQLYQLFNQHMHDAITYKTSIQGMMKENVFHITFKPTRKTLQWLLLNQPEQPEQEEDACGGYDEYVSNYIDWSYETKGIQQSLLTPRFLKRNLKNKANQSKDIAIRSGMQYKICRDTYHMFYIIGTEDAFIRHTTYPVPSLPGWNNQLWSQGLSLEQQHQLTNHALSLLQ